MHCLKTCLRISSLMMSKPKTFTLFQCFPVHHSYSVYGHMHVLAECTAFLKQLSSERKYRAVFHIWRNDKRSCPSLKCICNLYKVGMPVEVWSTLFMKDSCGTVSVFIMVWPARKKIVLGIHVIDPLLTNPLRSIWLNVGPGCFFLLLLCLFCFLFCFVSCFVSFFFLHFCGTRRDSRFIKTLSKNLSNIQSSRCQSRIKENNWRTITFIRE